MVTGSENPGLVVVTPVFLETTSKFRQNGHPIFGLSKQAPLKVLSHPTTPLF